MNAVERVDVEWIGDQRASYLTVQAVAGSVALSKGSNMIAMVDAFKVAQAILRVGAHIENNSGPCARALSAIQRS